MATGPHADRPQDGRHTPERLTCRVPGALRISTVDMINFPRSNVPSHNMRPDKRGAGFRSSEGSCGTTAGRPPGEHDRGRGVSARPPLSTTHRGRRAMGFCRP